MQIFLTGSQCKCKICNMRKFTHECNFITETYLVFIFKNKNINLEDTNKILNSILAEYVCDECCNINFKDKQSIKKLLFKIGLGLL